MSATRGEFLAGVPIAVDAARIDAELARLWHPGDEPETGGATRACLANLIALAPEAAERDRVETLLGDLASRFPSHLLVLAEHDGEHGGESNDSGDSGVRAWISAVCHRPQPGSPPVCCERITLSFRRGDERLLPGTVTPLLVPDVPVFLLLLGPAAIEKGPALVEALAGVVERVVLDSRDAGGDLASTLACERHEEADFEDLAWRTLLPWRRTLRDLFDEEEPRAILRRVRRVEIRCGERLVEGALLGGWLASRLGWSWHGSGAPGSDGREAEFRRGDDRLVVRLEHGESGASPRRCRSGVRAIALREGDDPTTAFVEVAAGAGGDVLTVKYCTSFTCVMPRAYSFRLPSDGALLGECLAHPVERGVFDAALEIAHRMLAS